MTQRRAIIKGILGCSFGFSNIEIAKADTSNQFIGGRGTPTIVLIHGLGADINQSFSRIFRQITGISRACAFNRQGYNSRYDNAPRNGETVARELRRKLSENNLHPPYIIIGHSLGGLYAQYFARLFASETQGLVLIDPTIVGQEEFLEQNYPDEYGTLNLIKLLWPKVQKQEFKSSQNNQNTLEQFAPFHGSGKILVASRISGLANQDAYFNFRYEHLQQLAKQNAFGIELVSSGHFIQNERPETVIRAIQEVMN